MTNENGKIVFKWTPTQHQAFDHLKHQLYTTTVLVLPNLHHPFDIETDTLDYALGAVITQSGHPVAFHSETFYDIVRRYLMYGKELYSIVQYLKQWRNYILGKEKIILTNHRTLQFTPSHLKLQKYQQNKWINFLQQFQLVIKYWKGKSNSTTDCLNRPPITLLFTVMSMKGYDTTLWSQLYSVYYDFSTIY